MEDAALYLVDVDSLLDAVNQRDWEDNKNKFYAIARVASDVGASMDRFILAVIAQDAEAARAALEKCMAETAVMYQWAEALG